MNLEKWYEGYLNGKDDKQDILADDFTTNALRGKILELVPRFPVSDGYCIRCKNLLDLWPDIIKQVPKYPDRPWESYQQPYFENTLELEASYRNGCQLCKSTSGSDKLLISHIFL